MEPNNLRLFEIINFYCTRNNKYLVHLKIKYKDLDERNQILDFYEGKLNDDFWFSIKNEDESFFEYDGNICIQEAYLSFPSKKELIAEHGEDCPYHIHCSVYDKDGILTWENC